MMSLEGRKSALLENAVVPTVNVIGIGREIVLQAVCLGCGEKSMEPTPWALCGDCVTDTAVIDRLAKKLPESKFDLTRLADIKLAEQRFQATQERSRRNFMKALSRDNLTCQYCGANPRTHPGIELHVDHVNPFCNGGSNRLDNLVTACRDCNLKASGKVFSGFEGKREFIRAERGLTGQLIG